MKISYKHFNRPSTQKEYQEAEALLKLMNDALSRAEERERTCEIEAQGIVLTP